MLYENHGTVTEIGRVIQTGNPQNITVVQVFEPLVGEPYSPCIDVRVFFKDQSGQTHPTKHGICIFRDIAVDVVTAILGALSPAELTVCLERINRAE